LLKTRPKYSPWIDCCITVGWQCWQGTDVAQTVHLAALTLFVIFRTRWLTKDAFSSSRPKNWKKLSGSSKTRFLSVRKPIQATEINKKRSDSVSFLDLCDSEKKNISQMTRLFFFVSSFCCVFLSRVFLLKLWLPVNPAYKLKKAPISSFFEIQIGLILTWISSFLNLFSLPLRNADLLCFIHSVFLSLFLYCHSLK